MHSRLTSFCALLLSLLLMPSAFAFDTPLSPEAVREAYFLGQRNDKNLRDLLSKYVRLLPAPDSGPDISSVTFLTPFALLAQLSSQRTMNYSAQQAELDHRSQPEIVRILVEIQLTPTYGAVIPRPTGSRSGSPVGYALRPDDFWKDFQVQVFNKNKELTPASSSGVPHFGCDQEGGCTLVGATLQFEFPAKAFRSDDVTIEITPPEGDPFSVDFDLSTFR